MLDNEFYPSPPAPLQCQRVTPDQIPQCIQDLPRLKARNWYLTKQLRGFQPGEMYDLEFQPAIRVLAAMLPEPEGGTAAWLLTGFEASGRSVLVAACRSTNSQQRINPSSAIQVLKDPSRIELLLTLLKDDVPRVRLNAVLAAKWNWDPRFDESFLALFHDPCSEVREAAIIGMDLWEVTNPVPMGERLQTNHVPAYLALLRDPDPEVQFRALDELWHWGQDPVPRAELVRLLGTPRMDTVYRALAMLYGRCPPGWAYKFPMGCPRFPSTIATYLLSSAEAAPLTTNRLTLVRLKGLTILRQNADAQAVALTLPLLRDTNSLVRKRAFALLKTVSGQDIPQDDPARWEQWWAANKGSYAAPK
jgi:HEAT repeat protein